MKFKSLLFLLVLSILSSCANEAQTDKKAPKALPKSQSKMAWEQGGKAHTTQTVTATLNDDNTITIVTQSVQNEKLSFNEIPYKVGVHPIGNNLTDTGDGLVGANFSIDIDVTSCDYIAIPDDEKENNHFAITYVDTSRGIVSGKFKMTVKKENTNSCGEGHEEDILFEKGEFAIKLS